MKFPKLDDEKLAEFVGILLGDGCIRTTGEVKITMHSEDDCEYITYVSSLIKELFEIEVKPKNRKNDKATDIIIRNKNISSFLISLGMNYSPKWNRATIPSRFLNKKCGSLVLRGLFDTDGCVVSMKRTDRKNQKIYPRLELKVSPSPMKDQIIDLFNQHNINFCAYPIDDRGRVHFRLNGHHQMNKWLELIGFSNPKHLNKVKMWQ